MGQIVLETGKIVNQDIFSHTVSGRPWMAHEWLAEVFMAYCYKLAGLPGVALAFFLIAGWTVLLLFKTCQKLSNEWSAFFAVSIAAAFAQTHLLARPHLFSWLFGALFLYLLIRNDRMLWFLPVLTAIWCNLHGGVLLGVVLQGAFLSGQFLDGFLNRSNRDIKHLYTQLQRPLYVFLLSLLALGCNPFGYALLIFPFQVSAKVFSQNIEEWRAPDLQQMWYVRAWLIMLGALLVCQGRKISWSWRLLMIFFLYQALGHIRHLSLAAMFLAPWTALASMDCCSGFLKRRQAKGQDVPLSKFSGPGLLFMSFLILFGVSMANPPMWQSFAAKNFSLPERYSPGAINYLKHNEYPGKHLLNEYTWGGYLLFALDPPPKVFIDGRADMYGEEVFSDYVKLTNLQPGFEEILDKYQVDWVLYPKKSLLIRYLEKRPGWQEVYSDKEVTILSRREGVN